MKRLAFGVLLLLVLAAFGARAQTWAEYRSYDRDEQSLYLDGTVVGFRLAQRALSGIDPVLVLDLFLDKSSRESWRSLRLELVSFTDREIEVHVQGIVDAVRASIYILEDLDVGRWVLSYWIAEYLEADVEDRWWALRYRSEPLLRYRLVGVLLGREVLHDQA